MTCTVCRAPDRDEIDHALVSAVPLRDIAGRVGGPTKSSLARHRDHVLPAIAATHQAGELLRGDALVSMAAGLLDRATRLLEHAEASGDVRAAVTALKECRSTVELLSKLKPDNDYHDDTMPSPRRWAKFITIVAEEFSWRPQLGEELDREMMMAVRGVLNEFIPRLQLGAHERLIKQLNALDREEA
jgi:hypothetical protein